MAHREYTTEEAQTFIERFTAKLARERGDEAKMRERLARLDSLTELTSYDYARIQELAGFMSVWGRVEAEIDYAAAHDDEEGLAEVAGRAYRHAMGYLLNNGLGSYTDGEVSAARSLLTLLY